MVGAAPDQGSEGTRLVWRERAWIALRVGVPCASGLWIALLILSSASPAPLQAPWRWVLFVLFGLILFCCLFLTTTHDDALSEQDLRLLRWQCVLLVLASLGSGVSCVAPYLGSGARPTLDVAAAAAGVGAVLLTSVQDWHTRDIARRRYALILLPGLMACELGLLGGWLVAHGLDAGLLLARDQRILSLVVVLIVVELLIFLRWVVPASPSDTLLHGSLRGAKERTVIFTHMRSWGGRILPAVLLMLTITNVGIYFAVLAWLLVLGGHVVRYYMLTRSLYPAYGGTDSAD